MKFDGKNINDIEKEVSKINDFALSVDTMNDFEVMSYNQHTKTLVIAASQDFCYYHNLEIKFKEVYFFSGDFEWRRRDDSPILKIDSTFEDSISGGTTRVKFIFPTDSYNYSNPTEEIVVWAGEIEFNTDTVLYWKKDKLKIGERIAEWVK